MAGSSSTTRMCSPATSGLHGGGRARHGHLDDEAAPRGLVVLDADHAAVLVDDLADDGQPEPHPGHLGREVGEEELLAILARDAGAVVAHGQAYAPALGHVLGLDHHGAG